MNTRNKIYLGIILFCLLSNGCQPTQITNPDVHWKAAKTTHTIDLSPNLKLLWELPVYTENDGFSNQCTAFYNKRLM